MGLPPFLSYGLGGGAQVCSGGKVFMKVCEKKHGGKQSTAVLSAHLYLAKLLHPNKTVFFLGGGWLGFS